MEYLQEYPSDDEEEDDEKVESSDEALNSEISLNRLNQQPLLISTTTTSKLPSTVESLQLFLQNYLYQRHQMSSIYLYMPWRPSAASTMIIRALSSQLEHHLRERFGSQLKDYQLEKITTNPRDVGYHISLTRNIPCNSNLAVQFNKNITKAFESFEVDQLAIGEDLDAFALRKGISKLFGEEVALALTKKPLPCLQIRFKNTCVLFSNPDYSSLFLGLPIRSEHVPMFHRMRSTIDEVMNAMELPLDKENTPENYHLTIAICKNNISPSISPKVFEQMQSHMSSLTVDASKLCFNTTSVMVRTTPSLVPEKCLDLRLE